MRLLICTTPRTGSNLLVDSLAKHPQAISASEYFHPPVPPISAPFNLAKVFSTDEGFPTHDELIDSATHIIYLYRRDRIAQIDSWEKARTTGVWSTESNELYECYGTVDYEHYIEQAADLYEYLACMTICYEDMIEHWNLHIHDILKAIGWPDMNLPKQRKRMP